MSKRDDHAPECTGGDGDTCIDRVIRSREKDLGGTIVRRTLPSAGRRRVGPFTFFDHFGPATMSAEASRRGGMSVRPHPHIGLATITYLYEGAVFHRDSLGSAQRITPGAINWMTAGRGIAHSERTPEDLRGAAFGMHGLQIWIALPSADEETEPAFHHHPAESLPEGEVGGVKLRQLVGEAYGLSSPVATFSPMFYTDAAMPDGATLAAPEGYEERAFYVVQGAVDCEGATHEAGTMLVLRPGGAPSVTARGAAQVIVLGGARLEGERLIWWNLVSSDRERLEAAKLAWKEDRFPRVPGEGDERIPLPEEPPHIELIEHSAGGEFRVYKDGAALGEMTWRKVRGPTDGAVMDIVHTGVRDALKGQGWARRLVNRGVREARERGWTILPHCSYARHVITTTDGLKDVLTPGWEERL